MSKNIKFNYYFLFYYHNKIQAIFCQKLFYTHGHTHKKVICNKNKSNPTNNKKFKKKKKKNQKNEIINQANKYLSKKNIVKKKLTKMKVVGKLTHYEVPK